MTAQIDDEFIHHGRSFALVGVSAKGLFNPTDLGLQPGYPTDDVIESMTHAADCYRENVHDAIFLGVGR